MTTETVLTDTQITEAYVHQGTDFAHYARAIEQAVLQSPEVQRLREDAARYRWLRDDNSGTEIIDQLSRHEWWEDKDAAIDAAIRSEQ